MTTPTRPELRLADTEGHTHDGHYHAHIGGRTPHNHTPTTPYRIPAHTKRIVAGIIGLILGVAGQWWPWFHTTSGAYSIAQIHGICTSGIGQIAQAIDSHSAAGCNADTAGYGLMWLVILVSAGLVAWGILGSRSSSTREARRM